MEVFAIGKVFVAIILRIFLRATPGFIAAMVITMLCMGNYVLHSIFHFCDFPCFVLCNM